MGTLSIILGIIGLIGSLMGTYIQSRRNRQSVEQANKTNQQMQDSANATNLQIAQDANAAQAAENEKAYERSKAGNQVNLMMQAGMSRAGALNALNGGGSYTPAPINTAQVSSATSQPYVNDSSHIDNALSGLLGTLSNAGQMKQFQREQDERERANKVNEEMTARSIKADIDLKNEQAKSLALQNAMDALEKDPGAKEAASRLVSSVKTTDYESFEDWYAAVREHAGEDSKYVDNPTVQNYALAWYERIGNAANVHADTDRTNADIKRINAEFKKLGVETRILKVRELVAQIDYQVAADTKQARTKAEKALYLQQVAESELQTMKSSEYKKAYENLPSETRELMNEYRNFLEYYVSLDKSEISDPTFRIDFARMARLAKLFKKSFTFG